MFLKTRNLDGIVHFYKETCKMTTWLDTQPGIEILQHGNLLVGFQQVSDGDISIASDLVLTFFFDSKEVVNERYESLKEMAISIPKENEKFRIYNFFAKDPDGRTIEFQVFNHELLPLVSI